MNEAPMIVQCPSCQTKFALDRRAHDEVDRILKSGAVDSESTPVIPRFHCSRCDHVFNLEESVELGGPANSSKNELPVSPLPELPPQPPEHQPYRTESSDGDNFPDPQSMTSLQRDPPRGLKIPSAFESEMSAIEAPHETLQSDDYPVDSGAQMSLSFPAHNRIEEQQAHVEHSIESDSLRSEQRGGSHSEESLRAKASSRSRPEASSWKGLAFFVAPIFLFLTTLIALTLYVRSDPRAAIELSEQLFPNASRAAPPGLFLKSTRFRRLVLESGDEAYIVNGKISNDTADSFREVIIEAIAFDNLGKPIQRTAVSASNTLNRAKLKSLSPEMIRNIQSAEPGRNYLLKPGTDQDFVIALGQGGIYISGASHRLPQARYFSARIYSVKK